MVLLSSPSRASNRHQIAVRSMSRRSKRSTKVKESQYAVTAKWDYEVRAKKRQTEPWWGGVVEAWLGRKLGWSRGSG
jgi:hypothetical protein